MTGNIDIGANNSTGRMDITGGTISGTQSIGVGSNGTGVLNITHGNPAGTTLTGTAAGGVVNQINVGGDSRGTGTLNVNLTDPNGVIISRELYRGLLRLSGGGSYRGEHAVSLLAMHRQRLVAR